MRATLSKFGVALFFALLAFVFSPLGGMGPMDVSASEVDEEIKEAIEERDVEGELEKEAIKRLEDKVKLKREDVEKKLEERLAKLFKDEEILKDLAELKEIEDELAKNGEDTWFRRPFAPRSFLVRPPQFFPRVFNPFRVRPFFFFDDDLFFRERFFDDDVFFRERFFEEEEDE